MRLARAVLSTVICKQVLRPHLSQYWFKALPSTLKYNLIKGTWKQLL
jgi:hypothetical protein